MAEATNPAGYQLQKLYSPTNTPTVRVATHADMVKSAGSSPMFFVVDNDADSGTQDAIYFWSGIAFRLIADIPSGARKIENWQVDTRAAAVTLSLTLPYSAFIEVVADETQSGARVLYYWNTLTLQEPLLL